MFYYINDCEIDSRLFYELFRSSVSEWELEAADKRLKKYGRYTIAKPIGENSVRILIFRIKKEK